jgi:putative aminopeptidase FrvX
VSTAPRFREEVLEALSTLPGVSGGEEAVREAIIAAVRDRVDTLEVDPLGSLIARVDPPAARKGTGRRGPHVMLCAHIDEVGIMVTAIEKEGRLRFRCVGGIDPRLLPSQVFRLGPRGVRGVVGWLPPHLTKKTDRDKVLTDRELYLDIGAKSPEDAESVVALGDFGVFDTAYERWGRVRKGKAFDDRAGASVLVSLVQTRPPVPVTAVWSVQEEVGLRGATAAARRVRPDAAIVLEGTFSNEAPGLTPEEQFPFLGKGPVLTIQDRSLLAHERLLTTLRETARRLRIPVQVKRPGLGSTDAGRISLAGTGVPAAVVSVPCRYIHAPAALLDVRDAERTVSLIWHALDALRKEWP